MTPQKKRGGLSEKKNLAKISSKTGLLHSSVLFIEKPTYNG
jgi:hypothetical protein